jgi:uncharacterized delta-60 repeat protein
VLVAGVSISTLPPGDLRGYDFALARYKPDGSLDGSFGGDGKVTTDFSGGNDSAHSIAIDSQGRIVAAGFNGTPESDLGDFALARFNPAGNLDSSFGTDGKVTTYLGGSAGARSVGIDSQGRIVAVGHSRGDFALARYKPNGRLDSSFGGDGKVRTHFKGGGGRLLGGDRLRSLPPVEPAGPSRSPAISASGRSWNDCER